MSRHNRYDSVANFVPAVRDKPVIHIEPPPRQQELTHRIDAPLSATQHVEMRTSAVDRSRGFLLASVPLYGAFALGVVLLGVLFIGLPFWSFWSFTTFWLSFVLAWAWGYRETLAKSAEGIAHYEARRKWDVIEREQQKRWEYYEQQLRGDE